MQMSTFAQTIYQNKYAMVKSSGVKEEWEETADRVATCVVSPYLPQFTQRIKKLITERKLMPGGRYLYAAGRKFPQINNCLAGETVIIVRDGLKQLKSLVGQTIEIVNRYGEFELAEVKSFGVQKLYLITMDDGYEIFATANHRWWMSDGSRITTKQLDGRDIPMIPSYLGYPRHISVKSITSTNREEEVYCCIVKGSESFTLGNGLITSNCYLLKATDSREGWGELVNKCINCLMTGGGIGVVYSTVRPEGSHIGGLGGKSTGPIALMQMVNECGRQIMQGGSRRSAIWAGLHWNHQDIFKFIKLKEWSSHVKLGKTLDFNFPAAMDSTNISVILDDAFFEAFNDVNHRDHTLAKDIYWKTTESMLRTAEPGFSVDTGENSEENLRNACTEVTSRDDGDMCNLASLNLARFRSISEFAEGVELGTIFLLCGTLYSKLPMPEMHKIREKNRRLGLGLMGVHEWLLTRGSRYESNTELAQWMQEYTKSGAYAHRYADNLSISRPIATRAIAPTGTISIIAETTSGIEPIYATAYKRRYLDGTTWKAQYKVDTTAKRIIESGIHPDMVEDALSLADDVERRMKFQSWLQEHVDHGISSTINLPSWGSKLNNESTVTHFGETLMKYLPSLRGITAYPDGSRGGQPLTKVPYADAIKQEGVEFVDGAEESCPSGVCGI